MNINDLEKMVRKERCIEIITTDITKTDKLSETSPACTVSGNPTEIYILNSLDEDSQIQAKAHELAHILLNIKGFVSLECNSYNPLSFFLLELNNAISHKYIIDLLDKEYNISSELHLKLLCAGIETVKNDIQFYPTDKYIYYGWGMYLFDVYETSNINKNYINEIVNINVNVKHSMDVAKKWISKINLNTPREEQEKIIHSIFSELNIPKEAFDMIKIV